MFNLDGVRKELEKAYEEAEAALDLAKKAKDIRVIRNLGNKLSDFKYLFREEVIERYESYIGQFSEYFEDTRPECDLAEERMDQAVKSASDSSVP